MVKLIKMIVGRIPVRTIVSIFAISIIYSYFRGFEASMFIFLGCMVALGAKSLIDSLIDHEKGRLEHEKES